MSQRKRPTWKWILFMAACLFGGMILVGATNGSRWVVIPLMVVFLAIVGTNKSEYGINHDGTRDPDD